MKNHPSFEACRNFRFRNTPETLRYFYHPDHIGSTSWVTDNAKNGIQYCEYLPYGEPFLDQRSTTWNSRYTFSGKERDGETGYSLVKKLRFFSSLAFGNEKQVFHYAHCLRRFGARYYNSDLSIWLSVDPMADKYPNLTPYAYCANNPIVLVNPDGEDIVPSNAAGEQAILFYIGNFSKRIQKKAFGFTKIQGKTERNGVYPVYKSSHTNMLTEKDFIKALGIKGKKMSKSEKQEAYAFYTALTDEKQYKVEGWTPDIAYTLGDIEKGTKLVEFVPNYAPREVLNNNYPIEDLKNINNFSKIFNSNRRNYDSENIFGEDFNYYKNYDVRGQNQGYYKLTEGVLVMNMSKENWKAVIGKAFKEIFE